MSGMQQFIQQASQLWQAKQGTQLANFMMAHRPPQEPPETDATDMEGLMRTHSRCQWLSTRTGVAELKAAYSMREKTISMLLPTGKIGLMAPGTEFLLTLLKRFLLDLRDIALVCDTKDDDQESGGYQQKCVSFLMRTWGTINNDEDRNWACVALYTVGWQCAHKMHATHIVSRWKLPEGDYKMRDTVTYSYWRGLEAFGSNRWGSASQHLGFVFNNLPAKCMKQRRMVLWRLIPARLLASLHREGHRCSVGNPQLFADHQLPELAALTDAFCKGNVGAFEKNLSDFEQTYVKNEVYIQLLKLRIPLYRNLLKRTYQVIKQVRGSAGRVPVSDLQAAAKAAGWDVGMDELECIVCTLIKEKFIKAKLDPERRSMMFHPSNAFPLNEGKLH